jgi:hypothetical protein
VLVERWYVKALARFYLPPFKPVVGGVITFGMIATLLPN